VPTPAIAMIIPARPGPTARARLNSMPLSDAAAGRSSFGTSSGSSARQVGALNASPADKAKVRISSMSGVIDPLTVSPATVSTATIQVSVHKINRRRSTMSPPRRKCEQKIRQSGGGLYQRHVERAGIQRDHQPGSAHALHERAYIRNHIGDQEVAKGGCA